jgi:hypothetical protein
MGYYTKQPNLEISSDPVECVRGGIYSYPVIVYNCMLCNTMWKDELLARTCCKAEKHRIAVEGVKL